MADKPIYPRILLKLSGEILGGPGGQGVDSKAISRMAGEIAQAASLGVEIAVVVGGGNIFRGGSKAAAGMKRPIADSIGMLATVVNALSLQNALDRRGVEARVMSAIHMPSICEPYIRPLAVRHLRRSRVVILAAGTGNPYFTTDTAAALRASEMECRAIFKGTKVDGVYSADPMAESACVRYDSLSYADMLARDLKVIDAAAIALARDNAIDILVFSIAEAGAFKEVLRGAGRYTVIHDPGSGDQKKRKEKMSDPDLADYKRRMEGALGGSENGVRRTAGRARFGQPA